MKENNLSQDNLSNSEVNNPNLEKKDVALHDIILKQHDMLLKQYEVIAKEKERKEDEIDLTALLPSFLKKKNANNEEIDSLESALLNKSKESLLATETTLTTAGNWFTRSVSTYFNGIANYWLLLLILTGLGAAVGGFIFTTAEPTYKSHITLVTENVGYKDVYKGMVLTLDELAETNSNSALAQRIGVSEETASLISGIKYEEYLQKADSIVNDSTVIKAPISPYFKIFAEVKDNKVLPELEEGLFSLLTENEPLDRQVKAEKALLKQSLRDLDAEKSLMDSLRLVVMNRIGDTENKKDDFYVKQSGIETGGGLILSENRKLEIEPTLPFNKLKEIDAQKRSIIKKLELMEYKLQVIENFAAINKPVFPRMRHLLIPIILAFALGTVLTTILYSLKRRKTA
ncbi:hypothetical protein [Sediminitomix flava]|uniref:Subunit length determinant protein n=1 Tax=Sediminitomix flava TaxID=379075 RepID=A0A315Z6S0_SEDFL|nr:hypothetical protein [Sediminitomix flava]PWJ39402.1 hypothetical protein BC781_106303 [Sediminitomix flava]